MKLFSEDNLLHYGIPGMKHGVRRWQYEDGRFNEEGKLRYFGAPKKRNINDLNLLSSYNKESYAKVYFSKEFNNITKDIDERRKNEILDNKTGLYLKNNPASIEDDVEKVNPYYNINKGFKNNCSFCSITYIERRAGYDSVANYNAKGLNTGDTNKLSETVFSKKNIKDSYYNPNYYKLETYKDSIKQAENMLNKLQDGEASIISIYNAKKDSGGHYLNAEKRNGKILILDTQPNKIYTFDEFKKIYSEWPIAGITNINYNNLEFNNINAVNNVSHGNKGGYHMSQLLSEETLSHYGIPGMKHGVRRWQYEDGRFNEEGKERYFGKKSEFKGNTQLDFDYYNKSGLNISKTKEQFKQARNYQSDASIIKGALRNTALRRVATTAYIASNMPLPAPVKIATKLLAAGLSAAEIGTHLSEIYSNINAVKKIRSNKNISDKQKNIETLKVVGSKLVGYTTGLAIGALMYKQYLAPQTIPYIDNLLFQK